MDSGLLNDYRCDCGKLLLKGILLTCVLEIKCKRCGMLKMIGGVNSNLTSNRRYALLIDRAVKILKASKSASDTLGYTEGELIVAGLDKIDRVFGEELYKDLWATMGRGNRDYEMDTVHRTKQGEDIKARINIKFFSIGRDEYALVVIDPVENEAHSELIRHVDHVADFASNIDSNGRYNYVHGDVESLLGWKPGEMLGRHINDFCGTESGVDNVQTLENLMATEQPFRVLDHEVRHKSGDVVRFETYFVPRRNDAYLHDGYSTISWKLDPNKILVPDRRSV